MPYSFIERLNEAAEVAMDRGMTEEEVIAAIRAAASNRNDDQYRTLLQTLRNLKEAFGPMAAVKLFKFHAPAAEKVADVPPGKYGAIMEAAQRMLDEVTPKTE